MAEKKKKIPRTIPNPEFLASEEYALEKERLKDHLVANRDAPEDYFPEDSGKKLPDEGAWIMILMTVQVGRHLDDKRTETITVPHLSIWFAMPTMANFTTDVNMWPSKGRAKISPYQAIIQTPQGQVHIWPHEYTVVSDISKFLEFTEADGFYINFLNPDADAFDEKKLFYIRSRGIPLAEARRMLLPEVKNPNYCYFTFDPRMSNYFPEGTGMMTLAHTRRGRREAHARA